MEDPIIDMEILYQQDFDISIPSNKISLKDYFIFLFMMVLITALVIAIIGGLSFFFTKHFILETDINLLGDPYPSRI